MTRCNRVTPLGELIATPERGLVYGNRGCLHDRDGVIRRRYATKRWIACRLQFRGRRRAPLMAPGRFTELFFLDEATALAAGHRPCAECRRADYDRFCEIWSQLHPALSGADAIDGRLHEERLVDPDRRRLPEQPRDQPHRQRRLHDLPFDELPDGAFVMDAGQPCVVLGRRLLVWSPGGYGARRSRPRAGLASVITPPSLLMLLRHEWDPLVPLLHPTATASGCLRE